MNPTIETKIKRNAKGQFLKGIANAYWLGRKRPTMEWLGRNKGKVYEEIYGRKNATK